MENQLTMQAILDCYNENASQIEEFIKSESVDSDELKKWVDTIKNASQGDQASIEIINQALDSNNETLEVVKSRTCNKVGYDYGFNVFIPYQKLWISHQLLTKASDIVDLEALLATACGDPAAGAALAAMAIALIVLKSKDTGCGIYVHWDPATYPGGPGVIVAFRGQ